MAQRFYTYLETVNKVLRRLREDEVTTVNATTYSSMIGYFVSDAVSAVAHSAAWPHFRKSAALNTAADTAEYVTPFYEDGSIFSITEDSTGRALQRIGMRDMIKLQRQEKATGKSVYWAIARLDPGTIRNLYVSLYPTPSAVTAYTIDGYQVQTEPTADGTYLETPEEPTVLLAYAYALQERGEDNRRQYNEVMSAYRRALAAARVIAKGHNGPKQWRVN